MSTFKNQTRTIKQRVLLSFMPPHRIKAFIDDSSHQIFNKVFSIDNGRIKIIDKSWIHQVPFYEVLSKSYVDTQILEKLEQSEEDYNSKFKKEYGTTLEEYEDQKLK